MWNNIDVITGYQTYPHVDQVSTGRRAAKLLMKKLRGEAVVQARVRIPMIVPAEGYDTDKGPFAELTRDAHALVESGKIMDFSLYQMQPWPDLPDAGSTVLVTAADEETAAACARELAHKLFDMREEMEIRLYSVDEVFDAVKENKTKMPVVLVDSADSPTAGSSSDSTFVLSALMERGGDIHACLPIVDAEAAVHAFEVGVGNEGEFTLGGTMEPNFQKRIKVRAYVKSLHDGSYNRTGGSISSLLWAGKTAVLRVGNTDVLLFERKATVSDPQTYRSFGIEPSLYQLVVVKSATQYKLLYRNFSTLFYPTDTPGSSSANLRAMPFRFVPRPFWPLDKIDSFDDTVTYNR
jgi:microcystin degradation protein MlrC